MVNRDFKNNYKIVYVNNQLGHCTINRASNYVNKYYNYTREDTGFIYLDLNFLKSDYNDLDGSEEEDVLILRGHEIDKLYDIKCDVMVITFNECLPLLDEAMFKDKKLAYVIYSIPTENQQSDNGKAGGQSDIRPKFERFCEVADKLVCPSYFLMDKILEINPKYEEKIKVMLCRLQGVVYTQ